MSPSSANRQLTPTLAYSSDSNSNSNQSPPGRMKADEETQTEFIVSGHFIFEDVIRGPKHR